MSHLKLENITKRFGSLVALNKINIEVQDQEFMVLLGPTGAGKTTTLRCVAGLEHPEEGLVHMDGEIINHVSPSERDMALVFQNYALYPRKTVFQNIAFPLEARKYTKAQMESAVQRVTQLLRINHLHDRLPAQLSGGEQQRVALARAMVRQPRLFLMDEPLTNLDFKLRTQMRSELKRIQQEMAATFFYVTNDQIEALSLGDRIAVLHKGELQQTGPPQEVYENPTNLFVAGFIGSTPMNFLDCSYDSNSNMLVGKEGDWRLSPKEGIGQAIVANGNTNRLVFGIRPEDITISTSEDGDLTGEVYIAEPLGDRIIYDIRLGQNNIKIKTTPTTMIDLDHQIKLNVNIKRTHIFDKVSSKAIRV
jgi:multiple sugar transport system ATP-binding protein